MPGFLRSAPARTLMIGAAAGLRSQTPNAVLAWHRDDAPLLARWKRWPLFRSPWGRRLLMLSGAGEMIVDKLPGLPPRTDPGPLFGRLLFGGLAGATLGSERPGKGPMIRGALLGMVGAGIGVTAGTKGRAAVVEKSGLPDLAVAVVEDVVAVTLANRAVTRR